MDVIEPLIMALDNTSNQLDFSKIVFDKENNKYLVYLRITNVACSELYVSNISDLDARQFVVEHQDDDDLISVEEVECDKNNNILYLIFYYDRLFTNADKEKIKIYFNFSFFLRPHHQETWQQYIYRLKE